VGRRRGSRHNITRSDDTTYLQRVHSSLRRATCISYIAPGEIVRPVVAWRSPNHHPGCAASPHNLCRMRERPASTTWFITLMTGVASLVLPCHVLVPPLLLPDRRHISLFSIVTSTSSCGRNQSINQSIAPALSSPRSLCTSAAM
jgi:hypothetical protein